MTRIAIVRQALSSEIPLGAKFVFRTVEILGPESARFKPPFEGQILKVVGYEPRYVNNVVVHEPDGRVSLLPADMVKVGLKLAPVLE